MSEEQKDPSEIDKPTKEKEPKVSGRFLIVYWSAFACYVWVFACAVEALIVVSGKDPDTLFRIVVGIGIGLSWYVGEVIIEYFTYYYRQAKVQKKKP